MEIKMPVWYETVRLSDVFHNEEMTFEQRRDEIVRRLRASSWVKCADDNDVLPNLIDELKNAADVDEFDTVWDVIYDYADADRVWIDTSTL
jgi:hypothetical protein